MNKKLKQEKTVPEAFADAVGSVKLGGKRALKKAGGSLSRLRPGSFKGRRRHEYVGIDDHQHSSADPEPNHQLAEGKKKKKKRKSMTEESTSAPRNEDDEDYGGGMNASINDSRAEFMQPRKKKRKLHTYEKAKLAYEKIQEERRKQFEERERQRKEREEALASYRHDKKKRFKLLFKKTKKGQPNLGAQAEYLLEKIQRQMRAEAKGAGGAKVGFAGNSAKKGGRKSDRALLMA